MRCATMTARTRARGGGSASELAVLGSLNLDYTVPVERRPTPGETVVGGTLTIAPGGKGANQAVAAAIAGARVAMLGCVGADPDGQLVTARLASHGVDCSGVIRKPGVRTGIAMISVTADGDNAIIVSPGANHAIDDAALEQLLASISDRATILLQGELQPATLVATLERLAARPTRVVLNLAPAVDLPHAALHALDCLVVNRQEAAQLLQVDEFDLGPDWALAALRALGPEAVVLTLGAHGAAAADRRGPLQLPALAVPVVDTTGAGDALVGTLATGLAQGALLRDALAAGIAAAAHVVQRPGAQSGMSVV
jgi:ribokinase